MKKMFSKILFAFTSFSTFLKNIIVISNDLIISIAATWISFSIILEEVFIPDKTEFTIFYVGLFFLPIFFLLGLYSLSISKFGIKDLILILIATSFYLFLYFLAFYLIRLDNVPITLFILQPILFFIFLLLTRLGFLQLFVLIKNQSKKINLIIYGAGEAGYQIMRSIERDSKYNLIAFIDDSKSKQNRRIEGYKVYGRREIDFLIKNFSINSILIAIPSIDSRRKKILILYLGKFNIPIKILPTVDDLVEGKVRFNNFKEIDLNDILSREVKTTDPEININLVGKNILVTGAGGSIGSELSLQIISYKPKKLILVDNSEFNLFKIKFKLGEYLAKHELNVEIIASLCDIKNLNGIRNIFKGNRIEYVFHAAAYKHVPILEENQLEAVENNVIGTYNLINSSIENEVKNFTLVSTDKAVRPTNLMGSTKRLSELMVQAFSAKDKKLIFSIVRFGNVLDSSGSVVPIFKEQILKRAPLTVTHPDITRFFMLIPEAVSLILEASSKAKGGEVFVLNMGDPIKILDLAKNMITLSGLKLKDQDGNGDIEIKFTGLRPGEKLHEELIIDEKNTLSINDRIIIAKEDYLPLEQLEPIINNIKLNIEKNNNKEVVEILKSDIVSFISN